MPPRGRRKYSLLELLHNKWERSPQIIIFSKNVEKITSDHHLFKKCGKDHLRSSSFQKMWERSPQIIIFSKNVEKINSDHHLFKVCLNLRTLSALLDVNKFLF